MGTIYVIKDPNTLEVRYVGKTTKTLKSRFACHMSYARSKSYAANAPLYHWMRTLTEPPICEAIVIGINPDRLRHAEREEIERHRKMGCSLLNVHDY